MTQEEVLLEISKCKESPYYFATKYLKVKNHFGQVVDFKTILNEQEFNKMFKEYESGRNIRRK